MDRASQDAAAHLVEIFASPQGEGPWVGTPTVFVRFDGCDLRCGWCDSPQTWVRGGSCRIERAPGAAVFDTIDNPVSIDRVEQALATLAPRGQGFVSLTGGEPLLQANAARSVATRARARGLRVYLETHGLATDELASVIDVVDVVSMDWKLPGEVSPAPGASRAPFVDRHEAFLSLAAQRAEVFVKLVLTGKTSDDDLDSMCEALERTGVDPLLVLQPVTPVGKGAVPATTARIHAAQQRCAERMGDVRVIPQTHRAYGAL